MHAGRALPHTTKKNIYSSARVKSRWEIFLHACARIDHSVSETIIFKSAAGSISFRSTGAEVKTSTSRAARGQKSKGGGCREFSISYLYSGLLDFSDGMHSTMTENSYMPQTVSQSCSIHACVGGPVSSAVTMAMPAAGCCLPCATSGGHPTRHSRVP